MITDNTSRFSNPILIFLMFIFVSLVNIILPIHFFSIFLAGIVFMSFIYCIKNEYWYSLATVVLTFIVIEISHGLLIGVLSMLSFFIYIFVIPKIKYTLTSKAIYIFFITIVFYIGMLLLFILSGDANSDLYFKILFNFFIDIFLLVFL